MGRKPAEYLACLRQRELASPFVFYVEGSRQHWSAGQQVEDWNRHWLRTHASHV